MDFADEHYVKLFLGACESPIERRFAEALLRADVDLRLVMPDRSWHDLPARGRDLVVADVQVEEAPYRLDFLLTLHRGESMTSVVVECDGHDFHERTKEQAQRDRARDRALTAKGAAVFRFTGSELHRYADACVAEAIAFLRTEVRR